MGSCKGRRAWTIGLCLPLLAACGCVSGGGMFGSQAAAQATAGAGSSFADWFTRRPDVPRPGTIWKKETLPPDKLARKELQNPSKVHLAYAKWQEQIGQVTEARESYEFVLNDEPSSTDAILGIARIDQLSGRTAQAEEGIQRALKLAGDDPHVLDAAGQFYATAEQWPEAIELLNKAVLNAPADRAVRFHLAVALARTGRLDAARPHFVQAVGEAEADYNLGLILHEQGDTAGCLERMQMALAMRPEFPEARAWLSELQAESEQAESVQLTSAQTQSTRSAKKPRPRAASAVPVRSAAAASNSRGRMPEAPTPTSGTPAVTGVRVSSGPSQQTSALTVVEHTQPVSDRTATRSVPTGVSSLPPLPPSLTPEQREQWRNQHTQ